MDSALTNQLNEFAQFFLFKPTWAFQNFIRVPHRIVGLFTGNQAMKTSSTAFQYVLRIMGWHPVAHKNVLYFECMNRHEFGVLNRPQDNICTVCGGKLNIHPRGSRIFRFAAETLPQEKETVGLDGEGQSKEIKNSTYPEFKKWLPRFLIKKDISFRLPSMSILDPNGGCYFGELHYPVEEIVVEFVSYNQQIQAGAGVQRLSVWCDEEPPKDFYEEQLPRLLAENGDFIVSLTPANRITWTYDEIFERAALYVRTKAIVDFYKEREGKEVKRIERTSSPHDIAVIQAATDDNPTLMPEVIDSLFDAVDDQDTLAIRRYGIFKQVTGRIFKDFEYATHVIDPEKYFPGRRMFKDWVLARLVDYHESIPWAIAWVALSPHDEAFVYEEWDPSPDNFVNLTIAEEVASRSENYHFVMNLFDPLASKVQTNTGISTIEDFNRIFHQLKHEGIGSGGYWESWDTKSTRGRDIIRMRLKNALRVGVPFNNTILEGGLKTYLPTIWVWNNCRNMARSLKQWRLEEWAAARQNVNRERKETPAEKFSHFCTALEAAFKDRRFRARKMEWETSGGQRHDKRFQGRR